MNSTRFFLAFILVCSAAWTACDTYREADNTDITIVDIIRGEGAVAEGNVIVSVHYIGMLASTGEVFDSSRKNDFGAISFDLTTGIVKDDLQQSSTVIDGFVRGVPGMRVGGLRRLTVPPQLAWGSRGAGCNNPERPASCIVPPNETLIFEIELTSVRPILLMTSIESGHNLP